MTHPRHTFAQRFSSCALLATLSLFTCLPLAAQKTEAEVRAVYMEILKAEGYVPEETEAGNIRFKLEGKTYIVEVYDEKKDSPVFVAVKYYIISDEDVEAAKKYEAANTITEKLRVVKVYLDEDKDFVIAYETHLLKPEDLKNLLPTILQIMQRARQDVLDM